MPATIKNGQDGADYEACLASLKSKGDARYGICMKSYEAHHVKNKKGEWVRKKGHTKNAKGEWIIKKTNFAGFEDWIPIFAGGRQVDSQGIEHDADGLIDQAVQLFDPEYHEAPVVVGHPRDNSPAFGWVERLKTSVQKLKNGPKVKVLLAKFKDVAPEFASAVKQGLYKKRSASFYPDGRLRHVGFLGGMPPAVKGLANLKFDESGGDPIIFGEQKFAADFVGGFWGFERIAGIIQKIRDYFVENKGAEKADKIVSSDDIQALAEEAGIVGEQFGNLQKRLADVEDSIQRQTGEYSEPDNINTAGDPLQRVEEGNNMPEPRTYSEEEMQAERERLTAEFAEKNRKAEEEAKAAQKAEERLTAEFAEQKVKIKAELEAEFAEKLREEEIKRFLQKGLDSGSILPAWEKMGLSQFMEALPHAETIEFGEGDSKKSETPYGFFKQFLSELPKTVNFGEIAKRQDDVKAQNAGAKLDSLTMQLLEKRTDLDYVSAFTEVQKQNPELAKEYYQELK